MQEFARIVADPLTPELQGKHELSEIEFNDAKLAHFRDYLSLIARTEIGLQLRSKLDASDMVQETLLEAFRQQEQCRGRTDAEVAGWLRGILRNNVVDAVRRYSSDKRDVAREVDLQQQVEASHCQLEAWLADDRSSPSVHAIRNEQLHEMATALGRLSELQREAIELYHLQNCSLAEVATLIQRTPSATAGLLHRGLKKLREIVTDDSLHRILGDQSHDSDVEQGDSREDHAGHASRRH